MKTAIIILNWNGQKLLEQFLPSIVNFSSNEAEIYVVDNASNDNSIAFIKERFSTVKIVQNATNGGYAKGYNDALGHIKADIYCLINSDIEVTNNWLSPILSVFDEEEKTAIIQPKLLDFKDKTSFEYAGAGGGFIDKFGYPYCRGRIFNSIEKDNGQFNDVASIFWASGACFFIRSKVFHQLNGFDQDYFAHQEEIDLCWRVKNAGFDIRYQGNTTVYHVGGATLHKTSPQKTFLNFRNSLLNLLKNTPSKIVFFLLFSRLILDGIAGVKFIFQLKPIHTLAIIKAHFSFYRIFPVFLKKRRNLPQKSNYYQHISVVWQYYVLGRKKYNNLK